MEDTSKEMGGANYHNRDESECECGHLDYEHVDAAEYNESTCRQCDCREFKVAPIQ